MVSRDYGHEPVAVSKATSSPGGTKHPAKRATRCRNRKPSGRICKLLAVQPGVQPAVRDSSSTGNRQEDFFQGRPEFILTCKGIPRFCRRFLADVGPLGTNRITSGLPITHPELIVSSVPTASLDSRPINREWMPDGISPGPQIDTP